MLPPFDLQLRERMGQGGGNHRSFFVVEPLGQTSFGAASRFLGFGFVDVLSANGHVGHNGDAIGGDLNEAFADRQKKVTAIFARDEFAGDDLSHQRNVLGIDAHLALGGREGDHLDIFREGPRLGSHDFEFKSGHADKLRVES